MAVAPLVSNNLWETSKYFIEKLQTILQKFNRKQYRSKIICELNVTEYGGGNIMFFIYFNNYFQL